MLKRKRLLPSFPDGWLTVYRDKPYEHDFSEERRNPNKLENMEFVVKLAYAEQSIRAQDYDFADQRGFSISAKVKTHSHSAVTTDCKVVIGNQIFGIKHIDRALTEMYLYMEGVSEVAE